jgi:hypothetical protein
MTKINDEFSEMQDLPEITKNEVIQGNNFYEEMKKYEGKESFNYWYIILIIISIIVAIIIIC